MWFDDLPVIGKMAPEMAARKLREVNEEEFADTVIAQAQKVHGMKSPQTFNLIDGLSDLLGRGRGKFIHTEHVHGFIDPHTRQGGGVLIRPVGDIKPDLSLKGQRIKVSLDRLRAADYPGGGTHNVLFDFSAQNQIQDQKEEVHFNMMLRVREGEEAGVLGYPIFLGLNVGNEGLLLNSYTVNVKNDADEKFLGFLESATFRNGLKLATVVQPALGPLSEMAYQLTRNMATRNRNVPVQNFKIGLDFGTNPTGARLAVGSYLAVQIPAEERAAWDWDEWEYNMNHGRVVKREHKDQTIPYNYIIFSVSQYSVT